jgi:dsRNA-specific ribonuclease
MMFFNYQRLEYYGDSIINYIVARLFYEETAEGEQEWQSNYFSSMKLHELKTWYTSNQWLALTLYEHALFSQSEKDRSDYHKHLSEITNKPEGYVHSVMPQVPIFYNDGDKGFNQQVNSYLKMMFENFGSRALETHTYDGLSLKQYACGDTGTNEDEHKILNEMQDYHVKIISDIMEALIGAIFLDSFDFHRTELAVKRLLQSRFIESFPVRKH